MGVMAADEDMDEDDSPTLTDELEKSTLSVADDRSVEFDSSTTLDELSTARTSPELPKSPKSSKSAIFSDSEQATNETSKNKNANFFIKSPPNSRNQLLIKIYLNSLLCCKKESTLRINVEKSSLVQIYRKVFFSGSKTY